MFFIYVVCIRLYVLLDVVYSFKYYILKIKKKCMFFICVCWIGGFWDVFVGDFSLRVLYYKKYCKKYV